MSVDPLATDFPWWTPYQFAGDQPIWAIDLEGKEVYVTIGREVVGHTWIRLIGSENVPGAPELVEVPVYQMTITNSASNTSTQLQVTRDAPVLNLENPTTTAVVNGRHVERFNVDNTAFDPARPDDGSSTRAARYRLIPMNYPDGTDFTAWALRNNDWTKKFDAVPVFDQPTRPDPYRADGVTIHIGGSYARRGERSAHPTGSLGCFTVNGRNAGPNGITLLKDDIVKRRDENKSEQEPTDVYLDVQVRSDRMSEWTVDSSGRKID